MGKKKRIRNIVIEFEEKDMCSILMHEHFIKSKLKEGKNIPAKVLNSYFSLFSIKNVIKEEIKSKSKEIKTKLIGRFSSDKHYKFKYLNYSFETMIDYVLDKISDGYENFIESTSRITADRKERLAYDIFILFYQYKHYNLSKKYLVFMSNYKLYILTAFILNELGFGVNDKKNTVTNSILFDKVKYTLDKAIKNNPLPTIKKREEPPSILDI